MALEEYKDIVGAAAGFVTICQMFSGVFLCKEIYNNGSTNKTPAMPFIGGIVLSILFYQHALILNDGAMGYTNLSGILLNVGYLIFYWLWTPERYAKIENPEKVEFRFGIIITVLLIFLIASPLFSLGEIIRTKSTESLPFPMIVSGFIVSAHWLLYGTIIKNNFVIFQNTVGFLLSFIQLMLFVIFPRKPKKDKTDGEQKINTKKLMKKQS